jgi:hypothetical protein
MEMRWAVRLLVFGLGSLSVGSLLAYFFGLASFGTSSGVLLTIEGLGLAALAGLARARGWRDAQDVIRGGLWAGCLATLVYDVVRIPIVHAGIPVFKAISYFGTVLLAVDRPTPLSDLAGWSYHASNGVSFGLMYAALVTRPGPITAVLWGLSLEAAMLMTPYAEVFGYQRDARFMAITIGSHACYGLTLWLALRHFQAGTLSRVRAAGGVAVVGLGLLLVAADFHRLDAAVLPPSPPNDLGSELHVTWDVPEPDRVAALWLMKRFQRPDARFHFLPPFQALSYGVPFDVPEAEVRRAGSLAATEVLIQRLGKTDDARLAVLGRMAHLAEVTPWMMPSDPEAGALASALRESAALTCGERLRAACLDGVFATLDRWYARHRVD